MARFDHGVAFKLRIEAGGASAAPRRGRQEGNAPLVNRGRAESHRFPHREREREREREIDLLTD